MAYKLSLRIANPEPLSDTSAKGGPRACAQCGTAHQPGTTALMACGACKATFYCNSDCQRSDWKAHKPKCLELREKKKALEDNAPIEPDLYNPTRGFQRSTPTLLKAVDDWMHKNNAAFRLFAIQCAGILPLKPGFNTPTHAATFYVVQNVDGEVEVKYARKMPMSTLIMSDPEPARRFNFMFDVAIRNPSIRAMAPYTLLRGNEITHGHYFIGEERVAALPADAGLREIENHIAYWYQLAEEQKSGKTAEFTLHLDPAVL